MRSNWFVLVEGCLGFVVVLGAIWWALCKEAYKQGRHYRVMYSDGECTILMSLAEAKDYQQIFGGTVIDDDTLKIIQ